MTHSAHRLATPEELKRDYVIFMRPTKGLDDVDESTRHETLRKTRELADIVFSHGPDNFGRTGADCTAQGENYEDIMAADKLNGFMSVFTDKETVREVLREIKEKDLGFSIVASGLTEDIFDVCREVGIKPHTVLYSLGIWGDTRKLPDEGHLKITTLCGHSMVSPETIDHYVEEIKQGNMTPEEAAKMVAKPCPCGIFNVTRTTEELRKLAGQ